MGMAPRTPGGGGKFKKAFEDLSAAENILIWTNPSPTSEWAYGRKITLTGKQYAAYSIFYKRYASAANTDGSSCIAARGANCYAAAGNYTRTVSISGDEIAFSDPNGGGRAQVLPYQVFGIKGTEM